MQIRLENIYKKFANNAVLKGVNFELLSGEIHALMGENGAGKSTLMNILTGSLNADSGQIIINDEAIRFTNAQDAELFGVTFIRQELNVWQNMTVLENLFIGKEIKNHLGLLNKSQMRQIAIDKFKQIGIHLNLEELVGNCSVGQQQLIEITKALMTNAKVIIMDEPTSALTQREANILFSVMHELKSQGVSIIYISHRMEEIFTHCDRITVMRDGITVSTNRITDTDFNQIVKEMVGRELSDRYPIRQHKIGKPVLDVENLTGKKFNNINFSIRTGEILGVTGLMGAGRSEIMRAIFGLDQITSGIIKINNQEINIKSPIDAINAGIAFITENRRDEGLVLNFSIKENIAINNMYHYTKFGIINKKQENSFITDLADRLIIKMNSINLAVAHLSGGNQQKVVIAKWLGNEPKILIMDEPTRGIDVNAKREIYQLMNELSSQGVAIIMISSELSEIIGMSDRVITIHEGKISAILENKNLTQETIMVFATGGNNVEI